MQDGEVPGTDSPDNTPDDAKRARKQARKEAMQARKLEKQARKEAKQARKLASKRECTKFGQESQLEAQTLAKLMEDLAGEVRTGQVILKNGTHELMLGSSGTAHVELKGRRGRKKSRLSIRVGWTHAKRDRAATMSDN